MVFLYTRKTNYYYIIDVDKIEEYNSDDDCCYITLRKIKVYDKRTKDTSYLFLSKEEYIESLSNNGRLEKLEIVNLFTSIILIFISLAFLATPTIINQENDET